MCARKRVLGAAALLVFVLAALVPAAGLAAPATWDEVLEAYPDHEIRDFDQSLKVTNMLTWETVVNQIGSDQPVTVSVYSAEGGVINVLTNRVPIATGQHILVVRTDDVRAANLMQVIIRGDVLGTGQLSIAQLTRMAAALNGSRPLEGLYAQAADLTSSGSLNIADLTILASWLRPA